MRVAILGFLLLVVRPAAAQRVLGIGGDAATLPAGVLRVGISAIWDRANERYDADGILYPLGANASTTSWNGRYDSRLALAQGLVALLSGQSDFDATLGTLTIGRRDASADAVLSVEAGVLSRLTIGARIQNSSHGIEPRILLNPGRVEGTMGFNPAWTNTTARNRNALIVSQFDSAVAQTTRRVGLCQGTPSTPGCGAILANVAGAEALVMNATAFASALNTLYGGRKGSSGLPFVPTAGSAAYLAMSQRILGYGDQFKALGITTLGTQVPTAAGLFSLADLNALLTDSLYGYGMQSIRTVHAYGTGELAVHAKLRVFDMLGAENASIRGFKIRQAIEGFIRVNGGSAPDVTEPFAPMAGEGSGAMAARSYTDLFYGERWSTSIVASIESPQQADYTMRVAAADAPSVGGMPFPLQPASREIRATKRPAARLDLQITPRVSVARNLWLGASWHFARQDAETWNVRTASGDGAAAWSVKDIAAFTSGTGWSEHRLTLGGTYSTVSAVRDGTATLPFDVTYEHAQTITGRGWRVSHLNRDVVTVRWYPRIWGRW